MPESVKGDYLGKTLMMTISLEQTAAGDWNVCLCQTALFIELPLEPAIRLAKGFARDEHHRLGRAVRVQMPGAASEVMLASYPERRLPRSGAR